MVTMLFFDTMTTWSTLLLHVRTDVELVENLYHDPENVPLN